MIYFQRLELFSTDDPREWTEEIVPGRPLLGYLPIDLDLSSGQSVVEVNSRSLKGREVRHYMPADGDVVVIASLPADPFTTLFLASIIGPALIGVGLSAAGSALFASDVPNILPENSDDFDRRGPNRGFSGFQNTAGAGNVLPIVYGEVRMGGQIIESLADVKFDVMNDPSDVTLISETEVIVGATPRLNTRVAYCLGPVEAITGHEIDGNPVANIKGLRHEDVLGQTFHKTLEGFAETKVQNDVSQAITFSGGPHTEQTLAAVDTVEVALSFDSGLFKENANNQIESIFVDIRLSYKKSSDAGFTTIPNSDTRIEEARRSKFAVWIRFPNLDRDIYDIKVDRRSADDATVTDTFTWDLMQEVTTGARSHPGVAQTGFRQIPQEQTSVPRGYTALVKGRNDLRIYTAPSTFTTAWSDNPAWCAAHFIQSDEGLGNWYTYDNIDKDTFIAWANHCDKLVTDGRTSTEKRCTFNFAFDQRIKSRDVNAIFSQGGDAWLVEEGGTWFAVLDAVSKLTRQFSEGSYVKDSLKYSFLDTSDRPNRLTAHFQNVERGYKRDVLGQEDKTVTLGSRFRDGEMTLWGVTRPSQVARQLRKRILKNRLHNRAVELTVGLSGLDVKAGDIIGVGTLSGGSSIGSGRLVQVTTDLLTLSLDHEVDTVSGTTYGICVQHRIDGKLTQKRLTGILTETTNIVTVGNANWVRKPQVGDVFVIGLLTETVERFRVMRTSIDDALRRSISAVKYDAAVYDGAIDNPSDAALLTSFQDENQIPAAVTSLVLTGRKPKNSAGDTNNVIDVSWSPPRFIPALGTIPPFESGTIRGSQIATYRIYWRKDATSGSWRYFSTTNVPNAAIDVDVEANTTYRVRIVAVSRRGWAQSLDAATETTVTTPA